MKKSNSLKGLRSTQTDFEAIKRFVDNNFFHFNAAALKDASQGYIYHLEKGGKMMITLAGAMSTAELGITLAEMIRQDKVHAIACTGANLEEDIFNLVAHDCYRRVPNYRDLSPEDEEDLLNEKFNRITDTCIPEEEAMKRIEMHMWDLWQAADKAKERLFPYEYMYRLIRSGRLEQYFQIDPKNSWLLAACEKNLPIFVPGWEDSTLGNMFVAFVRRKKVSGFHIVKSGTETMDSLVDWYGENTKNNSIGFFQIGGGIAGDFPICVVPLIQQDLKQDCRLWGYFCQISDSTTSYGSAGLFQMKKSPGENSEKTRRDLSLKATPASSFRWCSRMCLAESEETKNRINLLSLIRKSTLIGVFCLRRFRRKYFSVGR